MKMRKTVPKPFLRYALHWRNINPVERMYEKLPMKRVTGPSFTAYKQSEIGCCCCKRWRPGTGCKKQFFTVPFLCFSFRFPPFLRLILSIFWHGFVYGAKRFCLSLCPHHDRKNPPDIGVGGQQASAANFRMAAFFFRPSTSVLVKLAVFLHAYAFSSAHWKPMKIDTRVQRLARLAMHTWDG